MTAPLKGVERQLSQVTRAVGTYTDANGRLRDSNGRFVKGANNSTTAINKQKQALKELEKSGKKTFDSLAKFAKNASLGALGIGAAGIGVAGYLGYSSFNKAMDFEAQLSSIKALTGASEAEMKQMQALALEQGAQTKYNALEAAQAIEELLKAGILPAQVQAGALNAALNLATAGGLDLAEAAEVMSTSLNAFKKDSLTAAQAADILAGTANASATGVHELKYSLSMVAAVASGIGMTFKDTNTALGLFANNGLKGSDAGTSLKTMLLNLSPATKKANEAMMDLGIVTDKGKNSFFTAAGELKALDEIAGTLQKSLKGLTSEQRQSTLKDLFGTDGIRAANILYEEGAEGVKNFYNEMLKVTALDVAKEKMNNAAGAVEQFQGAWETLQISAMLPTLPIVKELALAAADFIDKYSPAITKAMEDAVNGARNYLMDNFINNPEFKNLPSVQAKIDFTFGKIKELFDAWWATSGRDGVRSLTEDVTTFMLSTLESATPMIASIGAQMGLALVQGILDGIANAPLSAVGNVLKTDLANNIFDFTGDVLPEWMGGYSKEESAKKKAERREKLGNKNGTPSAMYSNTNTVKEMTDASFKRFAQKATPLSGGIDRVPYHRFPALLHKDETVLTATEARKYRNGEGGGTSGGGIVINMHGTVIREDADVERLASALAQKLAM